MSFRLSREALERARTSQQAATVFIENRLDIVRACFGATEEEVVVAAVSPDLHFAGAPVVPVSGLRAHVLGLETGSWLLVFSPGTTIADVEHRANEMRGLAEARHSLLERILRRGSSSLPDQQ